MDSKSAVLVMVDGNISDPFEVFTGVLQGDVVALFLFIILVDFLMKKATAGLDSGVVTHPRPSRRYPAKVLNDLDFGSKMASAASDFKRCKALAWSAFWKLEHLWRSPQLTISAKVNLFYTTCVTILLYGCESWVLSQDMESKINSYLLL